MHLQSKKWRLTTHPGYQDYWDDENGYGQGPGSYSSMLLWHTHSSRGKIDSVMEAPMVG